MKKLLLAIQVIALAIVSSAALQAQANQQAEVWQPNTFTSAIVSTVVFGLIGIVLAIIGFKLFDAFVSFNLEQEICEKQNFAVAILCGAMVLGICIIIAAVAQ